MRVELPLLPKISVFNMHSTVPAKLFHFASLFFFFFFFSMCSNFSSSLGQFRRYSARNNCKIRNLVKIWEQPVVVLVVFFLNPPVYKSDEKKKGGLEVSHAITLRVCVSLAVSDANIYDVYAYILSITSTFNLASDTSMNLLLAYFENHIVANSA